MTIILPLPPKELSPNGRPHFMAKARAVKKYRQMAHFKVLSERGFNLRPRHKSATCQINWYAKSKRRRDGDNALASSKAAIDGIADSGFIDNDSGLTHLPVIFHVDKANPRVEITITPL